MGLVRDASLAATLSDRVIVLGGYHDSCICSVVPNGSVDSSGDASGADDDGSGTAAVVELARVLWRRYPKAATSGAWVPST
jgi:Zn-dependent M28 family amino/carboxypeptidase